MPDGRLHGQKIAPAAKKIALSAIIGSDNNFAARANQAGRAAKSVCLLLDADAPGDDSVFGADAGRHEDISHIGSSGFGGNAASGEMADLATALRAHVLAHVASAVVRPCTH
jgi:hypothetical protein